MTQVSAHPKHFLSDKVEHFTESVIREMTRQAMQHDAVNLAQGFPDFSAPAEIKRAAQEAIAADVNQYAITWGAKSLRNAIARQMKEWQGIDVDPEKEIAVCCGSTEAMIATLLAVCNKGDEVVVFEPFYENYGPDSILSGAKPRFVSLRPPQSAGRRVDLRRTGIARGFSASDRDPPHQSHHPEHAKQPDRQGVQPEGTGTDSRPVRRIQRARHHRRNLRAHSLRRIGAHFDRRLDGMRDRTITINGLSKSYSVTGWRVGWAVAPPTITNAIRKVHDFLTVGAPAPLQEAGAAALSLPASYYRELADRYRTRRDHLIPALEKAGFLCYRPRGAYYVMTDISAFGFANDVEFAAHLVKEIGIACVPGSSFYKHPKDGSQQVRFAFCKKPETLDEAARRLEKLARK